MNDPKKSSESFEKFIAIFNDATVNSEIPLVNARKVCLYLISEMICIAILKGINEVELNSTQMKYYYDMDHTKSAEQMVVVLKKICENIIYMIQQTQKDTSMSNATKLCKEYIDEHIFNKLSLKEIARDLKYSADYLSHVFIRDMNQSITDYIIKCKIEKAKQLLFYDTVGNVAQRLAFSSESYFVQVFKKVTGITPKKYTSWIGKE